MVRQVDQYVCPPLTGGIMIGVLFVTALA